MQHDSSVVSIDTSQKKGPGFDSRFFHLNHWVQNLTDCSWACSGVSVQVVPMFPEWVVPESAVLVVPESVVPAVLGPAAVASVFVMFPPQVFPSCLLFTLLYILCPAFISLSFRSAVCFQPNGLPFFFPPRGCSFCTFVIKHNSFLTSESSPSFLGLNTVYASLIHTLDLWISHLCPHTSF